VSHTPATSAAANANLVAVGARAHENVVRFEVTVNHSVVVRMMQREGDLADDADGARWSHRSFPLHKQAELLAFEELHRHELRAADRLTEIARLDDVAVAQRLGGFVLPPEALDSNGVARNLGVKHLDCDPFTGLTMPGFASPSSEAACSLGAFGQARHREQPVNALLVVANQPLRLETLYDPDYLGESLRLAQLLPDFAFDFIDSTHLFGQDLVHDDGVPAV
jgi:hypothetical protein